MPGPCVWKDWFPEPLARRVRDEEPRRFQDLIEELESTWSRECSKHGHGSLSAVNATLPHIPLVKGMLDAGVELDFGKPSYLVRLVLVLLDIIVSSQGDVIPAARWGGLLNKLFHKHHRHLNKQRRYQGGFTVPWRPLYHLLRACLFQPNTDFEYVGAGMYEARRSALIQLVQRARPYFPPLSLFEIWDEFGPMLRIDATKHEALGWLALFFPTRRIREVGCAKATDPKWWADRATDWLALWNAASSADDPYSETLWLSLFARLAKHDVYGVIQWREIFPYLANRMMASCFEVPIGSRSPPPPLPPLLSNLPSSHCVMTFVELLSVPRAAYAAQILISLVHRIDGPDNAPDTQSPVGVLQIMTSMLEQYYHPSNGGRWTGSLSTFLRSIGHLLCRRLVAECRLEQRRCKRDVEEDVSSTGDGEESVVDDVLGDDEDDVDDDGNANANANGNGNEEEDVATMSLVLEHSEFDVEEDEDEGIDLDSSSEGDEGDICFFQALERFPLISTSETLPTLISTVILPLATKAQSSKDKHMRRTATLVLGWLAQTCPDENGRELVLTAVANHFMTALDMITAASQYSNAILTLCMCVRPMLQMRKGLLVGQALTLTLPCIDPNDPVKTIAVFRLYCAVLSNITQLPSPDGSPEGSPEDLLPFFDGVAWSEDLLSRLFAAISAVTEAQPWDPSSRAAESLDSESFLMEENSMFRPLIELLLVKLPPAARRRAVTRIYEELLKTAQPSVLSEASVLCAAASSIEDPEFTIPSFVMPMLKMLEGDVGYIQLDGHEGSKMLSNGMLANLTWRLALLSASMATLGPALISPFKSKNKLSVAQERLSDRITAMALDLMEVLPLGSQRVKEAAASLLSSIIDTLANCYPLGLRWYITNVQDGKGYAEVEAYFDRRGQSVFKSKRITQVEPTTQLRTGTNGMWHVPVPEELGAVVKIVRQCIVMPSQTILQGIQADSLSQSTRNTLSSALSAMYGGLSGIGTLLPDFLWDPTETKTLRSKYSVVAWEEELLASSENSVERMLNELRDVRALAAEAVAAVLISCPSHDSELLSLALSVAQLTIAYGSADYIDSVEAARCWIADDRWVSVSSEGVSAGGTAMVRPAWLILERLGITLQWRSSQNAYRWYHDQFHFHQFDKRYLAVLSAALHWTLHAPTRSVIRSAAASLVENAAKRFPALSPYILAHVCCAITKVPWRSPLEFLSNDVTTMMEDALNKVRRSIFSPAVHNIPEAEAESEADQAPAVGAAALLIRGLSLWRYVMYATREEYHAAPVYRLLITALAGGYVHSGSDAQMALGVGCMMATLRFILPASLKNISGHGELVRDLITVGGGSFESFEENSKDLQLQSSRVPPAYIAAGNAFPLMSLQALDATTAVLLAEHYSKIIVSATGGLDGSITTHTTGSTTGSTWHVALSGLLALLKPLWMNRTTTGNERSSERQGFDEQIMESCRRVFLENHSPKNLNLNLKGLLDQLALRHTALLPDASGSFADEHSSRRAGRGGLFSSQRVDDTLGNAITGCMFRHTESNPRLMSISAILDHHFIPAHARLTLLISQLSQPTRAAEDSCVSVSFIKAAETELSKASSTSGEAVVPSSSSQRASHNVHATLAAVAEVLSGILIHEAKVYKSGGVFDGALDVLEKGLHSQTVTPLGDDVAMGIWRAAVRFTFHEICVAEHFNEEAAWHMVERLTRLTGVQESSQTSQPQRYKQLVMANQLFIEMVEGGHKGEVFIKKFISWALILLQELVLTGSSLSIGDLVIGPAAELAANVCALALRGTAHTESCTHHLCESFLRELVDVCEKQLVLLHEQVREESDDEVREQDHADDEDKNYSKNSSIRDRLTFIAIFCYHGVRTRRAELTQKWLLRTLLPSLLRLEDAISSEWQSLWQATEQALAALKYHVLVNTGEDLDSALTILNVEHETKGRAKRRQRLAALSYLQHFWFRHIILLMCDSLNGGDHDSKPSKHSRIQVIVDTVIHQLQDDDSEVRRAASANVAGLARLDARFDVGSAVRQRILCTANQVFFGSKSPPSLKEKHGAVLGLAALVHASPYDIPPWLPGVLALLVKLAGIPNPALVRTTVTEALAEFRRTHPIESIDHKVAEVLTPEEWDAIRDIASPASYFV